MERLLEVERQERVRTNKRIARRAGLIENKQSSEQNYQPIPRRNTPSMIRRRLEQAAKKRIENPVLSTEEMDKLIRDKEAAVGIGEN